jgi:hypothetical protein
LKPELLVLNVDQKQEHFAYEDEQAATLQELLATYAYQVHYAADSDIVRGILKFAGEQAVQLIIALPAATVSFTT